MNTSVLKMLLAMILLQFLAGGCDGPVKEGVSGLIAFNDGWEFIIADDSLEAFGGNFPLEDVQLPHTPVIEPLVVNDQWQGTCWYRKQFLLDRDLAGKNIFLKFDAAMNVADVWINGVHKVRHLGGYLPFMLDLTAEALPGDTNEVVVRLDNRDNPVTGPKPLEILDFNMYGGLYRDVHLIVKDEVHITDPILEQKTAGGGIFVRFPRVSDELATIEVQTHVRNSGTDGEDLVIRHELLDASGPVGGVTSGTYMLGAGEDSHVTLAFEVRNPRLWSPRHPNLYALVTRVTAGGRTTDTDTTRIGIKRIGFSNNKLVLNGEQVFLRGVNRHQEYPYVGYALSNQAQYRDAVKIKEAGFDYVRLSHYPHSPAFMDACDELGLLVIDAILGWQYYSDDRAFHEQVFSTCRDLVRRDRNHACVLAWEVSLNESWMPEPFIDSLTAIAHAEYPGDQCFTAGWQAYGYDIYLQARQHRLHHYDPPDKPYVVSEYGDWEYYAMNAGLDQDAWSDLKQEERSSRQLLSGGEERLLQQATNIQEAHNDNFNTPAFADGYWVMFDYNRGYADDLEASGIMSITRLPKFSYYFFRSQRDADDTSHLYSSGPMVFIASYWSEGSGPSIRVFSNCDSIALFLDNSLLAVQSPDTGRMCDNLAHPPFTFRMGEIQAGTLKAIGYLDGREAARYERLTPLAPQALRMRVDESGRPPKAGAGDHVFVHAEVTDSNGTIVPANDTEIRFKISGDGELVSPPSVLTEAGIATALVRIGDSGRIIRIKAIASGIRGAEAEISPR